MEEELSMDNILDSNEVESLFVDNEDTEESSASENIEEELEENTTEVNSETLFEDEPESVGSEENNIEEKEDTDSKKVGSSPNTYVYSSIAKALREEGVFPDLNDDTVNGIKSPEDFKDLIEQQIQAGLDDRQKRIDIALNAGVEPTEIKKYENTISYLSSLKDAELSDESDKGETLRKQLIYQDFINRGYSKERATREVTKSLNAGTDIEDAKESLKSNIDFFKEQYNGLINEAKAEEDKAIQYRKEQAENLRKSILDDKKVFGELSVDKSTRQKIYDNIAKPVYKDPETGELFTAIQKYEMENKIDFLKNISLIFTLTNGFKNMDGLVKGKVNREIKKGLRELEATLNNTARTTDGNIRFVSGVSEDPESFITKGWSLDV